MDSLTQEYLRSRLNYDPETGIFTWRKRGNRWNDASDKCIGKVAGGRKSKDGYYRIGLLGKKFYVHRLAFIYMLGECPELVDHRDLDVANNRWSNLRPATKSQNGENSKQRKNATGVKGIHRRNGKYIAELIHDGQKQYVGRFATLTEASSAINAARQHYHGEFARAA